MTVARYLLRRAERQLANPKPREMTIPELNVVNAAKSVSQSQESKTMSQLTYDIRPADLHNEQAHWVDFKNARTGDVRTAMVLGAPEAAHNFALMLGATWHPTDIKSRVAQLEAELDASRSKSDREEVESLRMQVATELLQAIADIDDMAIQKNWTSLIKRALKAIQE